MASALDKLREHTAALLAVAEAARDLQQKLERVRAELPPLVEKLREASAGLDRHLRELGRTRGKGPAAEPHRRGEGG